MAFNFYAPYPKGVKNQKNYMKKTKLPQDIKSLKVFCRNCNAQNTNSAVMCKQCDVTIREPKLRRKML